MTDHPAVTEWKKRTRAYFDRIEHKRPRWFWLYFGSWFAPLYPFRTMIEYRQRNRVDKP